MSIDDTTRDRWKREVEREFADPRAITGWRTWNETWSRGTRPLSDRLIQAAHLAPGLRVLDVGSGTGDPALTIAGLVGPTGGVVASDPSPGMLKTAEEQAERDGLANLTFRQADVAALPFPDASFDRVTCRLGAMYFLDPVAGLAEMRRVLKPGGRAAVLVWGDPAHANYAAAFFGPILGRMALPAPEPGAPHPYRFATPGTLRRRWRKRASEGSTSGSRWSPCPSPAPRPTSCAGSGRWRSRWTSSGIARAGRERARRRGDRRQHAPVRAGRRGADGGRGSRGRRHALKRFAPPQRREGSGRHDRSSSHHAVPARHSGRVGPRCPAVARPGLRDGAGPPRRPAGDAKSSHERPHDISHPA